jgi:uncharacterized protein (TIGR03066 family)
LPDTPVPITVRPGSGTGFALRTPLAHRTKKETAMRTILSLSLGLLLCSGLSAEDKKDGEKIDAQKLVGKWSPKEAAVFTVDLTKDGKATLVATTADGKGLEAKGTYKVDGNKLTTTVLVRDKEQTRTFTISKLTSTELVSTDEKGKEVTLVRIEPK